MKKLLLPTLMISLLSGCVLTPTSPNMPDIPRYPSAEWVNEQLPRFRQAAEQHPTEANLEAVARLEAFADQQGKAAAKRQQVTRELTLAWNNHGRGGAAIRQPAYIHVLGEPFNAQYAQSASDDTMDQTIQEALDELDDLQRSKKRQGYSFYELSRWKRFCDRGRGMDEPDWRFVTEQGGRTNIPEILRDSCDPPSHDYQDYLSAWTRFCEADQPTREDRDIVRDSVRPKSVVNPCAALDY